MNFSIISPTQESEKALSIISDHLVNGIKKEGVSISPLTYEAGSPLSFLKLVKNLNKYEIIHLHHEYGLLGYYGLPFFVFLPLLKTSGKKIIINMHTILPLYGVFTENKIKNFFRKSLYFLQNKIINYVSDAVIVNENFLKEILLKDYKIEKNKIVVIPQGVIENPPLIDKNSAKKELGLNGNVFLIIGNITSDSGADIILGQSDKIGKTILFVTNPKGVNIRNKKKTEDYVENCKKIVLDNNFGKFVRFDLKEINNKLWWEYLSAADLIIQSYRGDVRSGVFSDAMAARVPVIASDIPFFREMAKKYGGLKIVQNNKDYPSKIKEALKPTIYKKMKEECERYVKENGLSAVSKQYKKLYEKLLYGKHSNNLTSKKFPKKIS